MDHSSSKPPKHHKGGASGSTDRQSVDPSQSGPQVAKKGAHTSSGPDGAFVTEDSSNPEAIAQNLEWQMEHMSISRSPPSKPFSTGRPKPKPKPKPSNTQPQPETHRRSEVQAHPPAPFAQGPLVAVATDEHRHPQPRTQSNQSTWGQPQQVSHAQRHQMPHGQVSHGHAHHVPRGQVHHGQVHHGQTHHDQVSHVQTHQMSHGHTHHAPHGQMHAPLAYAHTPQPAQVQIPRATEGGTSSHDQQRSADTKRGKHDYMPAVTANQRTSTSRR